VSDRETLLLYDLEQRIAIEHPGARKETLPASPLWALPAFVRFIRPAPGMNMILYSRVDEAHLDQAIDEQVAYFQPLGQPFEWIVYEHDSPPGLKARLEAHGFQCDEPEPLLVLDLHQAPPALLEPVTHDVRRITQQEGLEDVVQVMQQVYGSDFGWIRQRLGSHLKLPEYLSVYIAYAGGHPACAGWIYFHPRSHFAGLWGGSTVAEHRRKGLYTALLALRVQEAIRRGYRYLTINASEMSRPIVSKYGFALLAYEYAYRYVGKQESAG
jgi:GNAT superfamily N-acetyltransferase